MIQWKDLVAPEILLAGETKSFLVRVRPDNLDIVEEPGATIAATVYTDVGIFTKTGYTVAMRDTNAPLGNVYLTDTLDTSTGPAGALNNAHMLGHRNNLPPGTNTTFYMAIADLDTAGGTQINSGARLIINIPPGFTNVKYLSYSGFNQPTVTIRADGITQIIAVTNEAVGNLAPEAKVLSFSAFTPTPNIDSTYILFAFIDGLTNGALQINAGALAEPAIQINVP